MTVPPPARAILILVMALAPALAACSQGGATPAFGDPQAGRAVIRRQACGSCHVIPGDQLAVGRAGPPLAHMARRAVIAGMLPNTPDNLALWVRQPQEIVPGNAMPDMGLSERQARDVAAYLETLR